MSTLCLLYPYNRNLKMVTTVSMFPDWRESEKEISQRVLSKLYYHHFFSKDKDVFTVHSPRTLSELDRLELFIRYEVVNIEGKSICTVEKVIEQKEKSVLIRHRNTHPSRKGKMEETHTTSHVCDPHSLVDILFESVLATISALYRLNTSKDH